MCNDGMATLLWSEDENALLKAQPDRTVHFEGIVSAIECSGLLDDIEHLNDSRYPHQRQLVLLFNNYIYCVPDGIDGDTVFLKSIYPSRKLTRKYLSGVQDD
jgi:hypothetical protein